MTKLCSLRADNKVIMYIGGKDKAKTMAIFPFGLRIRINGEGGQRRLKSYKKCLENMGFDVSLSEQVLQRRTFRNIVAPAQIVTSAPLLTVTA